MEAEVILDSVREAEGVVRWFDGTHLSLIRSSESINGLHGWTYARVTKERCILACFKAPTDVCSSSDQRRIRMRTGWLYARRASVHPSVPILATDVLQMATRYKRASPGFPRRKWPQYLSSFKLCRVRVAGPKDPCFSAGFGFVSSAAFPTGRAVPPPPLLLPGIYPPHLPLAEPGRRPPLVSSRFCFVAILF